MVPGMLSLHGHSISPGTSRSYPVERPGAGGWRSLGCRSRAQTRVTSACPRGRSLCKRIPAGNGSRSRTPSTELRRGDGVGSEEQRATPQVLSTWADGRKLVADRGRCSKYRRPSIRNQVRTMAMPSRVYDHLALRANTRYRLNTCHAASRPTFAEYVPETKLRVHARQNEATQRRLGPTLSCAGTPHAQVQ